MSPELLLLLFAFAVPGAMFVEGWDVACHRKDRSLTSLLGHGIIISLIPYVILMLIGAIDLQRLGQPNGLTLGHLLARKNVYLFLTLCGLLFSAGYKLGKRPPKFLMDFMGTSFREGVWTEVMEDAAEKNACVRIRTRNGWTWMGYAVRVPEGHRRDDCVALTEVELRGDDWDKWVAQDYPVALIALVDIEFILIKGGSFDVRKHEAADGRGCEHQGEHQAIEQRAKNPEGPEPATDPEEAERVAVIANGQPGHRRDEEE